MNTYKDETLKQLIKYINGKNTNLDRAAILASSFIAAGTICGVEFVQGISTAFTILGASIAPEIKKGFECFNKKSKENEAYANYERCKFAESVLARLAVKQAVENMTQSKSRFISRWKISNELSEDKNQEIYEKDIQRENKYNKLFIDTYEFNRSDYWDELIGVIEKVIEIKEEGVLEFRDIMKEQIKACYTAFKIQIQLDSALFYKYNHIIESEKNIEEIEAILNNSLAYMSSGILPLRGRVTTKLNELNEEYKKVFSPVSGELLPRSEFEFCTDNIKDGKSIIIHGKAGIGKSGCTQSIVLFCEKNRIPYVAIKLDKRVPRGCAEKWGMDLGLPDSIAHTLNGIAENENAVIILDQLDALRWTQSHSRDALIVCSEIIQQVKELNKSRKKKISMVLVCRTYDLENDNNIKSLFENNGQKNEVHEWVKILFEELSNDTVKKVVGESYDNLTNKLKSILKIPSNLYIWEKLDREKTYDDISTTNELIYEWWRQLSTKSEENGISEKSIQDAKENIVKNLEKHGRLSINRRLLNVEENSLEYLVSNGFLMRSNRSISFTHQSILDYFLAEKMFQRYYEGENILSIIGSKETQTPSKRYQIQMLLQFFQEDNQDDFIEVGKQMLESSDVRFYVKYVFLEVLGQCKSINLSIENFILEYCEKEEVENHIIDNVIDGHQIFVNLLLKNGVLDKWMKDDRRKNIAINLMISLCPQYSSNHMAFIKKYAFIYKEDDKRLFRCFSFNIQEDTDKMFELRMEFYRHYPEMSDSYMNFKEMFQNYELRAINVLELLLNYKVKNIYSYEEELLDENSEVVVKNGKEIIDKLLPYIPREKEYYSIYSSWYGRDFYNNGLERACVEIIKKANIAVINKNPEIFIEKYKEFMGKEYVVFNEIILAGLKQLPTDYSDMIVNYIATNLDENILDKTSGNKNELALVKAVLRKHTVRCSEDIFLLLEKTIISYIDPEAKECYRRRIEHNRDKENGYKVYWSFWGDMQIELLPCLPVDRISMQSKMLLKVLNRRFKNGQSRYNHLNVKSHSGGVSSPIASKQLGNAQWLQILTNNKLNRKKRSNWIEVKGGFIESSIEQFSRSFHDVTSAEPERFINLLLGCSKDIHESYIDSLFSGVAFSNQLNEISTYLLEKIILKYSYNYDSFRARDICAIIEKKENADWSQDMIDILNDIAINHSNPDNEKPNVTSNKDKEMKSFNMLESNALNCVRGTAARAIGKLLWSNKEQYVQFKDTVSKLCNDVNPAVRLANLSALSPIYNIDRDWATEKILYTFEKDYRMAGYRDTRQLLFLMYSKFRECVLKIILKCYFSDDKGLTKMGAYSLTEMYIQNSEFKDEVSNIRSMNETQVKSSLEMALIYFNKDKYNDLVKSLIKRYVSSEFDLQFPLYRIFYDNLIDLERDKEFLIEIMKYNVSRRMIHYFVEYLEKNSKSISKYNEIIFSMSYTIIQNYVEYSKHSWGIENELSKLIIGLYDETANSMDEKLKNIAKECLNIWDLMFEKRIGHARRLSHQMLDRRTTQ